MTRIVEELTELWRDIKGLPAGLQGVAREARSHSLRRRLAALIERETAGPTSAPGPEGSGRTMAARRASRGMLPRTHADLVVAGFGTDDDWRRNGLWKAFRERTLFRLFEVPDERYPGCRSETEELRAKARDFLRFVDHGHPEGAVHVAFFSHSGRHIADHLIHALHKRGIWTVVMSVDDKHQFVDPHGSLGEPHQLRVARQVDLYWTNWPLAVRIVANHGGNPWFAPPAADPRVYRPLSLARDLDVVFVGGRYGARARLVDHLRRRGVGVHAFGPGWPGGHVAFEEMIALFSRGKIVLGVSGVGHGLAIQTLKGRDFEVPMCGAAYLTSYNHELCDCYDVGREVLCYASDEECLELTREALSSEDRCAAVRQAALVRAQRDHTWTARVKALLDLLPWPALTGP